MLELRARHGMAIVFVTHDIDESVYLGDRMEVRPPDPRDQVDTKEARVRPPARARLPLDQTQAASAGVVRQP